MPASLLAAVSWLACLVRHPDICTLPSLREPLEPVLPDSQVDRGWSEKGNLTLCENLGKVDRAHHPIQRAHRIVSIVMFMLYTILCSVLMALDHG